MVVSKRGDPTFRWALFVDQLGSQPTPRVTRPRLKCARQVMSGGAELDWISMFSYGYIGTVIITIYYIYIYIYVCVCVCHWHLRCIATSIFCIRLVLKIGNRWWTQSQLGFPAAARSPKSWKGEGQTMWSRCENARENPTFETDGHWVTTRRYIYEIYIYILILI